MDVLAAGRRDRPDDDRRVRPGRAGNGGTYRAGQGHADRDRRRRRLGRRQDRVPRQRRRVADLHRRRSGAHSPGDYTRRVPLDRPGGQRRGHQVGDVHDRGARELHAEPQRRVRRHDARPEVADRCATTPAARSLRRGPPADAGPQRRHDRRHGHGEERAAPGRAGRQLAGTTRLDVSTLTTAGDQAGFVLWNGENPNTFAKITYISKGTTPAVRVGGDAQQRSADIHARPADPGPPDATSTCALSANGAGTYIAEGSTDGETWQPICGPITDLGDPTTIKVGLKVSNGDDSTTRHAGFDYFRVDCSDQIAPTTTATLDPAQPDGKLGWYSKSPEVTLDGRRRRGRRRRQDRPTRSTAAPSRPTTGPFTVTGDGEHVVEYFATDKAGQRRDGQDGSRSAVDGAAPTTTATVAAADAGERAGDGHARRRRRHGLGRGADRSTASTAARGRPTRPRTSRSSTAPPPRSRSGRRPAPGGFELLNDGSGGITPRRRPGHALVPVRPTATSGSSCSSARAATDGGYSNGGVFVRFPDPRAGRRGPRVRQAPAARPTTPGGSRSTAATRSSSTTAPTGETAKTGSIYNFDNNDIDDIGPRQAVGEWEDYEIEVVGQTYTIRRNGEVIKEFENSPGKESTARGDPPTSAAPVHAGLHRPAEPQRRGPDAVPQRPRRGPLAGRAAAGARPKPFTVTGTGPHTVEVRSIDAAGNVEAKQTARRSRSARRPPEARRRPPPLVPQAPVSPIMPPMTQPHRDGEARDGLVEDHAARRSPRRASRCRSPAPARWTARRR